MQIGDPVYRIIYWNGDYKVQSGYYTATPPGEPGDWIVTRSDFTVDSGWALTPANGRDSKLGPWFPSIEAAAKSHLAKLGAIVTSHSPALTRLA